MHPAGSAGAHHISKAAPPDRAVSVHTLGWRQYPETPRQDSAQVKRTRAPKLKGGTSDRSSCRQVKILRVWVPKSAWHSGWCWDGRVQTNLVMHGHSQWTMTGPSWDSGTTRIEEFAKEWKPRNQTHAGIINICLQSMSRGLQKRIVWGRYNEMGKLMYTEASVGQFVV